MSSAHHLQWSAFDFPELNTHLLHDILKLRVDVFVVEQNCPYPEVDGQDPEAVHVVGQQADGALIAYARIIPPEADGVPHVGRVVVAKEQRGTGLGKRVMQEAFQVLRQRYGSKRSAIAAQTHLQQFYSDLGYVRTGEDYLWDGIPHVDMVLGVDNTGCPTTTS